MKQIILPGSKSITNRVLVLAALGERPVELYGLLDSDDARYMQAALVEFGVQFESIGKNALRVMPPSALTIAGQELFIGNAGTAARFLSALSLVATGHFTLTGIDRMKQRPQADLQQALKDLGVAVECLENEGFLPARFTAQPEGFAVDPPPSVFLSGNISSQFLTALLLVAPSLEEGLEIYIEGEVPSWPYIEMTLELLKVWGVDFIVSGQQKIIIKPGLKSPRSYSIPADMSSASYPIAWAILSRTPIEITNFGTQTLQGDEGFLDIATQVGTTVKRSGEKCQIIPNKDIAPIGDFDWSAMPDVAMTGMILAAIAPGTSTFTGLESLRVKECDRILAMEQLRQLGFEISVDGDVVTINGGMSPEALGQSLVIDSFDDHRIAMCFALLRATSNLSFDITEPGCVAKTWPEFWVELADWQGQLRSVSAVILHRTGSQCGLDKYLIVKKPRKNNAWQFPQGGLDAGETWLKAAKRELQEECGAHLNVKFKGERAVGEYKYLFPIDFKRHKKDVIGAHVQFFYAEHLDGKVEVDNDEIVDYVWVTKDQFAGYFEDDYLTVVQDLF